MLSLIKKKKCNKGQSVVEYALTLALIAVVSIGILRSLGQRTYQTYDTINVEISEAGADFGG